MKCIILYGHPGVGKLTVAKILAKNLGYTLFHNHMVFNLVHDLYTQQEPEHRVLQGVLRKEILESLSRSSIKGVVNTWVWESTNPQNHERVAHMQKLFDVVFVQLTCDEAELMKRFANKDRVKDGKLVDKEFLKTYYKNKDVLSPIPNVDSIVIDTTNNTPEQTCNEILSKL